MLHGPPHGALHLLALVNNGACLTDGNSVTPAQVTSIKEKSIDLTVLAGDRNSILVGGALLGQPIRLSYRERRDFWAFQNFPAVGTSATFQAERSIKVGRGESLRHRGRVSAFPPLLRW
jgi:hypothetical protein